MNGEDRQDANRDLRLSANEYMNALDYFPQDDEFSSSTSLCRLLHLPCLIHLTHPST